MPSSAPGPASPPQIKIIYKKAKKGAGHGHHGGAWKVAFADFMTAMMALFLVLWIMAQSEEVKHEVAAYFRPPAESEGDIGTPLRGNKGVMDVQNGRFDLPPRALDGTQQGGPGGTQGRNPQSVSGGTARRPGDPGLRPQTVDNIKETDKDELRDFLVIADHLWEQLGLDASFGKIKDQFLIEAIEDGLVVQLLERDGHPLLDPHSQSFVPAISSALATLGSQLSKYPHNKLEIDGHGFGLSEDPTQKWIGTTMLADLARKALESHGLSPNQITKVAGCADTRPLDVKKATGAINRRISILVHPRQWRPERY